MNSVLCLDRADQEEDGGGDGYDVAGQVREPGDAADRCQDHRGGELGQIESR